MVSKINCSKNDARRVAQKEKKQFPGYHSATPAREYGEFGMAAGEAVVVRRFQPVQRILQNSGKPESPEWWEISVEKTGSPHGHCQIPKVRRQKSQRDQESVIAE